MRKQRALLRDITDPALFRRRMDAAPADNLAAEFNQARVRAFEAAN